MVSEAPRRAALPLLRMWIAHSKLIHCDTCTCRADTQNVVMYDDATSSYAAYIRIDRRETDDNPHAGNVSCPGPNEFKYIKRRIGRCDLADLSKPWTCNQTTAKMVLSFDRFDPVCFGKIVILSRFACYPSR